MLISQVGPGRGVAARGPLGRGPMQGRAGPPAPGPRGFSGAAPARLRNAKGNLPSMLRTSAFCPVYRFRDVCDNRRYV